VTSRAAAPIMVPSQFASTAPATRKTELTTADPARPRGVRLPDQSALATDEDFVVR